MSFCGKCGREIPDGARFCMKCGIPVHEAAPVQKADTVVESVPVTQSVNESVPASAVNPVPVEAAVTEQPQQDAVKNNEPKPKRKLSVVPAIIAAVVCFVVLAALATKYYNPSTSGDVTGTGDSLTKMIDQADINLEYIDQ